MTTELVVKKLLLATAVVAAAGGAGYLYQNNTTPSDSVLMNLRQPNSNYKRTLSLSRHRTWVVNS